MKAVVSSETSVNLYETTRWHIPLEVQFIATAVRTSNLLRKTHVKFLKKKKSTDFVRTILSHINLYVQYSSVFCSELPVYVLICCVLETRPHGNNLWREFHTFMRVNSFIPFTVKPQPISWKLPDVAVPYLPHIDS